jgi:uncharacterized protein with ParB-like and HNH nuclease domain
MKTFDPKNENLIEIFSQNNRYQVPIFQRGYDWGKEQIENFWLDLESVNQRSKDSLFFGNFIFLNNGPDKKVLSIIDGQQRITTLQFLLIAIRTRAKALNDEPLQISAVNNLIEYVTNKFAKQERTGLKKVIVAKSIRPLFDTMSDYKWDGIIPEKIDGVDGRTYRKIKRKIEPVYNFFYEKVRDLNTQELADILASLEKIFVTKIEIEDPEEAFDIFERTNARGVKLAQSDLVKNLLFQNTDESLHNEIDQKWEKISLNSSDRLSQMLKYYIVSFRGKTLQKEIFPTLSLRVKDKTSETLINELLDFSLFYKMMSDEGTTSSEASSMSLYFKATGFNVILKDGSRKRSITRAITSFQLFKITQVYPLIYSYVNCLHKLNDEIEERNKITKNKKTVSEYFLVFIQRLENFHFINTVIGKNIGNQIESLYANYSEKFSKADKLDKIIELENDFKKELLELRDSRKTFVSEFSELNYDEEDTALIVYIFDRISNAESKGDQIYDLYNPDKDVKAKASNIEHFYPRKMFEAPDDVIGSDFGNNIGNLLVIPMHTNGSFNCASPKDKFTMIEADPKHLINIGNRNLIIMKYKDINWDRKLIEQRALDLANYAFDKVWSVNI